MEVGVSTLKEQAKSGGMEPEKPDYTAEPVGLTEAITDWITEHTVGWPDWLGGSIAGMLLIGLVLIMIWPLLMIENLLLWPRFRGWKKSILITLATAVGAGFGLMLIVFVHVQIAHAASLAAVMGSYAVIGVFFAFFGEGRAKLAYAMTIMGVTWLVLACNLVLHLL